MCFKPYELITLQQKFYYSILITSSPETEAIPTHSVIIEEFQFLGTFMWQTHFIYVHVQIELQLTPFLLILLTCINN